MDIDVLYNTRYNAKRKKPAEIAGYCNGDEGNRTPVRNQIHRSSTSVVTALTFPP